MVAFKPLFMRRIIELEGVATWSSTTWKWYLRKIAATTIFI